MFVRNFGPNQIQIKCAYLIVGPLQFTIKICVLTKELYHLGYIPFYSGILAMDVECFFLIISITSITVRVILKHLKDILLLLRLIKRGVRGIIHFCVLYSHLLFSNIGIRALIKHFLITLMSPSVFLMRKIRKETQTPPPPLFFFIRRG